MAQAQMWNPVADVRSRYPGLKSWSDSQILTNLSEPARFRSAFPQYAGLSDEAIRSNIAKLSKGDTAPSEPTSTPSFIDSLTAIQKPDPNHPLDYHEALKAIGNIGGGGLGLLLHPIDTLKSAVDPIAAAMPSYTAGQLPVPNLNAAEYGMKLLKSIKDNPYGFLESSVGQAGAAGGLTEAASGVSEAVRPALNAMSAIDRKFSVTPVEEPIQGVQVPMLKSEAQPSSHLGRLVESQKQSGVGKNAFTKFSQAQTESIREVIRNIAQRTSQMIGPVSGEPGAALGDASKALQARAKPMYQALDAARMTVPDQFTKVSEIMQGAINRARKLGVTVDQGVSPKGAYVADKGGLAPTRGQPFQTYQEVRSALLKAKRTADGVGDAKLSSAINNELDHMNGRIEEALQGSQLLGLWKEANYTWARSIAVQDVADAFTNVTKGIEPAYQAKSAEKIPTRIQGPSLVDRLKKLDAERRLSFGFSAQERADLLKSADILDRAREQAGRDQGIEPGRSYSPRTMMWRYILRLPFLPLVKAMTTPEGLKVLESADKLPAGTSLPQVARTLAPLYSATAAAAVQRPRGATQ